MGCTTPVDCESWGAVNDGQWEDFRINVGGTLYWFTKDPDPVGPEYTWHFKPEVGGNPPDNNARIDEDDWNVIRSASCTSLLRQPGKG